jgi:hypothetical protein
MPALEPVFDEDGAIVDITIAYGLDLKAQMLDYSAMTKALR